MPTRRNTENNNKQVPPRHKLNLDNWLAIANLILTAIVGIVIAIYLQIREQSFQYELQKRDQEFQTYLKSRDEEFQKRLIEIQSQANITNIAVTYSMVRGIYHKIIPDQQDHKSQYPNHISIENKGLVPAKNLRITICLDHINPDWETYVGSIDEFEVIVTNPSIKYNQEFVEASCRVELNNGNNASAITIESLAPGEALTIAVRLNPHTKLIAGRVVDNVHVFIHFPLYDSSSIYPYSQDEFKKRLKNAGDMLSDPGISDILAKDTALAYFTASASCDNCQVSIQKQTSLEQNRIFVPTITRIYKSGNFNLTNETSEHIKFAVTYYMEYASPTPDKVIDTQLYLSLSGYRLDSNYFNFIETTYEDFLSLR